MHRFLLAAMTCLSIVTGGLANDLLIRAHAIHDTLLNRSVDARLPLDARLSIQLRIGAFDPESAALAQFRTTDSTAAAWLNLQYSLDHYQFTGIPQLPVLRLRMSDTPRSLALRYRWLLIQEDLAAIDQSTRDINAKSDPVRIAARAEFKLKTLEYDSALVYAGWASTGARVPSERTTATITAAKALFKLNRFAECRDSLVTLFDADHLDANVIFETALVLIQLGETRDAIDLLEESIRWNPWQEGAQYFLGNGYSRLNYTQIADSAGANLKRAARLTRQGADHWTRREYDAAETKFREALRILPTYGRARAGLARALEGRRMLVNVHRAEDERSFDAKPMPHVPRIDEYILNWKSLAPRHRKQVALAVEPWQRYIPLLVECGEHHYMKPLHEKLSECPNMQSMKDQRISYDTRLWDDVRGCGGFTTVTGIEDVERSIYFSYNTVLHELTHQVHGTLPSDDQQRIENQWAAARKLDDAGTRTFMSRYQASSAWEYFAEGANAYFSPRRDSYDPREIVRERLLAMDTALVAQVEHLLPAPNLDACWPVGLINASDDAVERADLKRAQRFADQAARRAPHAEVVLAAQSRLHSLRDEDAAAIAYADSLVSRFPEKARSYSAQENALFMSRADCDSLCVEVLRRGLSRADSTELKDLRATIGGALERAGRYAEARGEFQSVLDRQPTDYAALWGEAVAMQNDPAADSLYKAALAERTGIAALRCDYAEYLLNTGRSTDAKQQVDEAALIKSDDPTVLLTQGALLMASDPGQALALFDRALAKPESPRLAAVRRVSALRALGRNDEATAAISKLALDAGASVPRWVYDRENSGYTIAGAWDAKARAELAALQRR
jgi:tetratricopeptide (TPR) repeat protein